MPGIGSFASFEPTRYAMGDTRRYAERMQLIAMTPRGDLTSTGYALANPGKEYLILQPLDSTSAFTVQLRAGSYTAEWFSVKTRRMVDGGTLTLERDASHAVAPPFTGPAVLYLKKR